MLAHGQEISAEQIERICGREFSAGRFARLCNCLLWSMSWRDASKAPSFTERIYVRDRGRDAEADIKLEEADIPEGGLLKPGWNVAQYKLRDITQNRRQAYSNLKNSLTGELTKLRDSNDRAPSNYVIYTNLHLTLDECAGLEEAILTGWTGGELPLVQVVHAAGLAPMINGLPHLRSAFFATNAFQDFGVSVTAYKKTRMTLPIIDLVGRDAERAQIKDFLSNPDRKALVVHGPHMMGKTSLVLDTCIDISHDFVEAIDPRSLEVTDLFALRNNERLTTVLIEDPAPDRVQAFVEKVVAVENLRLVVTVPTAAHSPDLNLGQDTRIQVVEIGPLNDEQAHELLGKVKRFDVDLEDWIVSRAGGVPGVLLAATTVEDLRTEGADFMVQVARSFENRARQILGDASVEALSATSLLRSLGITGDAEVEAKQVCEVFWDDTDTRRLLTALPALEAAGYVKRTHPYVEAVPPFFANHLAAQFLQGRGDKLRQLFWQLSERAQYRILQRLAQIKSTEAQTFIEEMFASPDLLGSPEGFRGNTGLLRRVSPVLPSRAVRAIKDQLETLSLEQRRAISGEARSDLRTAIEDLMFVSDTSQTALHCMGLLAEAENESYANNCEGLFCVSFHAQHPQLPLPLDKRLAVLGDLYGDGGSETRSLLATRAALAGLSSGGFHVVRHSTGADPLGATPRMTWGELWEYEAELWAFLKKATESEIPSVRDAAVSALYEGLQSLVRNHLPGRWNEATKELVSACLAQEPGTSIHRLASMLAFLIRFAGDRAEKAPEDQRSEWSAELEHLRRCYARLDDTCYSLQVRRWVGGWGPDSYVENDGSTPRRRAETEIEHLASLAASDPALLDEELQTWLCSPDAKRASTYFGCLGIADSARNHFTWIEGRIAQPGGYYALAAYFGGWGRTHPDEASERLDAMAREGRTTPIVILLATQSLRANGPAVERIVAFVEAGQLEPIQVAGVLVGWTNGLSIDEFERLTSAVAGSNFENSAAALQLVYGWIHAGNAITGTLENLVWTCLEAGPESEGDSVHYCDEVAKKLAEQNTDRGFSALKRVLAGVDRRGKWNPLEEYRENAFFRHLAKADAARALKIVFDVAVSDSSSHFKIIWNLSHLVDSERDFDFLIACARSGQDKALIVCEALHTAQLRFWDLAIAVVNMYPDNDSIRSRLRHQIIWGEGAVTGELSLHYQQCARATHEQLEREGLSSPTRTWLSDLETALEQAAEDEREREVDRNVNT